MIDFETTILKFNKMGEKTGWTYIELPVAVTEKLKPGCKKSYKVKGKLDDYIIAQVALIPMGEGHFIIPVNAAMRKGLGKRAGDKLKVSLMLDNQQYKLNVELMLCLADEPSALTFFKSKPVFIQNYFSKWVDSAKTDATKIKRIAMAVAALAKNIDFVEMMRLQKDLKKNY